MFLCLRCELSFTIFKYLNKYALTTNVSAYVKYANTFACQNYLCKIVMLCISDSACQKQICGAQPSYINSSDMQMHIYLNILNMVKDS